MPTPAHATRAWQEAEAYIADRTGADIVVGCGDSMHPLYRSGTLLVIERRPYKDWRPGQTVEIVAAKEGGPSLDWLNAELGYIGSPRSRARA